jgi:hypothetical protein
MSRTRKRGKIVPGWNEYVRQYRDSAIFWHRIWKENGSPSNGILFEIRKLELNITIFERCKNQ